jgi:hypothetical protein
MIPGIPLDEVTKSAEKGMGKIFRPVTTIFVYL